MKRLNVITALLAFAFGLQTAFVFYESSVDFIEGFKDGYESAGQPGREPVSSYTFALRPENFSVKTDSVYNAKSNTWIPARTERITVDIPSKEGQGLSILALLAIFILIVAAFFIILSNFLRFILTVNQGHIFERQNIKRLRLIGIGFLLMFIAYTAGDLCYVFEGASAVEIPNYTISKSDAINAGSLIISLIAFLVAEIFAAGQKLKEEQELTI